MLGGSGLAGVEAQKKNEKREFSRKKFLKLGLFLAGLTGANWLFSGVSSFQNQTAKLAAYAGTKWARNLGEGLTALATHAHPEDEVIFSRNLLTAIKLKMLGEFLKKTTLLQPMVAYNVGSRHVGIGDFLILPSDILRTVFLNINPNFVKKAIDLYGPRNVATVRLAARGEGTEYKELPPLVDAELLVALEKFK